MSSPLLANVYLHYVFDLWAHRWRRREAKGNIIILLHADDVGVGFEHEADVRRFWDAMRLRLEEFSLALHPDKKRLLEFGRYAAVNRQSRCLGRSETFASLGFIFIGGRLRRGSSQLQRNSRGDRMRAKLRQIKEELRRREDAPIPVQGKWLGQVVRGYFAYHAVNLWRRALRRHSQKDRTTWVRVERIADA